MEVEEQDQYFIKSVKFANLNKRNTIKEYEKEIIKGDYLFQDVKITRELYFNNIEELESFNNSLMFDFDFINGTGGSCTDDERINDIKDFWNMSDEERDTVEWYLKGIAVYFNNELQYIIDAQGYSYARYVGLVCKYTKNEKKVIEKAEEEKIEMEMNFDDILESFENVEIKNENRLCEEDLNFLEDLQEKFNNAKVGFEKYIEFYRENKICNLEEKEIKISCDSLEEYFVRKVVFIEGKGFISKIYNYFEKKYNITLERIKINDDYSLDFREKEAKQNLKWFMETLDYNLVLDNIFNQLNGVSFKDREKEELKREFEYSKPVIKGNSINLKNSIYFNDISLKYNNNYEISYNSRGKFKTIFKLIDVINKNDNKDLCDNIIFEKNEVIGIHELKGDIIKSIQVFKNGSIKLICDTGLNALNIAKEYLNYKEVA